MPLEDNLKEQLKSHFENTLVKFADSASQLLNEELSITISAPVDSIISGSKVNVTEPSILINIATKGAVSASSTFIINNSTACLMASKMMGNEETIQVLDGPSQDALITLFSQSFNFNVEDINIDSVTLTELDPANPDSLTLATLTEEMQGLDLSLNIGSDFNGQARLEVSCALAEYLLGGATEAGSAEATGTTTNVSDTDFAEIKDNSVANEVDVEKNLNLLMDIRMGMIVELGRAEMHLKDILKLTKGSIIELDRLSGEPVDLFVNNKLIARGEVVVIDDNFGLRITQLAGTKAGRVEDLGLLTAGD